jgi:prepilin signal peptidase PulO-like enzyme (type II secretory pathway)
MLQPEPIILVWVALLGVILGSFLNAIIFRYHSGKSALQGRSACMHCGKVLGALELVPILSYLWLRGRCRHCHARISPQYPLVELGAGVLAVGTWLVVPDPAWFAYYFAIHLLLLFVFVYDLRHKIIPTVALVALAVLTLLPIVAGYAAAPFALVAGPILALPLFLFSALSGGRWMGWGDAPLMLSLGWLLGLSQGLTAFMLAFWSGALVGIALMLLAKGYRMKSELPFAPFLIGGAWVAYFLHVDFFPLLPLLLQ